MKKSLKVTLFILLLLVVDQIIKFLVKTNMALYEEIKIFEWCRIYFIENPGMAFGMTIGSKAFLTIFRLVVSFGVLYYIVKLVQKGWRLGYIFCVSLIFAGAIGNIFDSLFYGLIFSESTPFTTATLFPSGGGYTTFLHGKVVDMFYFPIFEFPEWIPFLGGETFFSPIFNFADSCITVGIFLLLIFFRKDFNDSFNEIFSKQKSTQPTTTDNE